MRDAGADQALVEVAPSRNPQAGVLKPGAAALFRPIAVVGQWLVDESLADLAAAAGFLLLDRDGNREMRNAVEEIDGAIERIDNPPGFVGIAGSLATFLEQHAPIGACVAQFLDNGLFGPFVGHRDEVARPLAADLELLDLAEVAAEARRRLARGAL